MKYLLQYNEDSFSLIEITVEQEREFWDSIPNPLRLDNEHCQVVYGDKHSLKEPPTLATTYLMDCFENIIPEIKNNDEIQHGLRLVGISAKGFIHFPRYNIQVCFMVDEEVTGESWDNYFANLYKPRKNKPSKRDRNNSTLGERNAKHV